MTWFGRRSELGCFGAESSGTRDGRCKRAGGQRVMKFGRGRRGGRGVGVAVVEDGGREGR